MEILLNAVVDFTLKALTATTPFILVLITLRLNAKTTKRAEEFSREAEQRANEYSDALKASDDKKLFLDDAHRAIDNLYIKIQMLYTVNMNRASQNEFNFKIEESKKRASEDTYLFDSMLIMNLNMTHELTAKHESIVVDIDIASKELQRSLDYESTLKILTLARELRKSSKDAGAIDKEKMKGFVDEVDNINNDIKFNPEKWLNRSNKE